MLSAEQLEMYRRMTNAERLVFTLRRIREEWKYLTHGTPQVVARRFELLRRQNDERNRNLRVALSQQSKAP